MSSIFDKEFMMEMFLDSDSASSANRMAIALANVISENNDNLTLMQDVFSKELTTESTYVAEKDKNEIPDETYLKVLGSYHGNFENTFKMSRNTFQALLNYFSESVIPNKPIHQFENKICIFILLLSSDISFEKIAQLFDVQKLSMIYSFMEIANVLMDLRYDMINWPSKDDQHLTRLKIYTHTKFPNCIGFLDATNFRTSIQQEDKLNEVLLQAICNEYYMFLDVFVGDVGNLNKLYLYQESPISSELSNTVDAENHVLATSDYELDMNLITPYIEEESLTDDKIKFNTIHKRTMVYINRAFNILKQRFSKLNYFIEGLLTKPEEVKALLYAVCVLHNFVIYHDGCPSFKEESLCDDPIVIDTSMIVITASGKRQFLTSYINCTSS